MSKTHTVIKSIIITLHQGVEKKYFNSDEPFEFVRCKTIQGVSVTFTNEEFIHCERVLNIDLSKSDERMLRKFYKKISKQNQIKDV